MNKRIIIIDYGLGNIFSVARAFSQLDISIHVTSDAKLIATASHLVLPGVGAFKSGMDMLKHKGLDNAIKEHARRQKPLLGICLGMQMFFEESEENEQTSGLGLVPGQIKKIAPLEEKAKVPHIGWAPLKFLRGGSEYSDLLNDKWVYFVHSYHPIASPAYMLAQAKYGGVDITAIIQRDNILGFQFHPEKSGPTGLKILDLWVKK